MKNQKYVLILLGLILFLLITSLVINYSLGSGGCKKHIWDAYYMCGGIAPPLFSFSLAAFIPLFLFYFVSDKAFWDWLMFSAGFIAFAGWWIYRAPVVPPGYLPMPFTDKGTSTIGFSVLYLILSLVIIGAHTLFGGAKNSSVNHHKTSNNSHTKNLND